MSPPPATPSASETPRAKRQTAPKRLATITRDEALRYHSRYGGKLEIAPKTRMKDAHDLSLPNTPGVAEPCR